MCRLAIFLVLGLVVPRHIEVTITHLFSGNMKKYLIQVGQPKLDYFMYKLRLEQRGLVGETCPNRNLEHPQSLASGDSVALVIILLDQVPHQLLIPLLPHKAAPLIDLLLPGKSFQLL